MNYAMQAIGIYMESEVASTLKQRDSKDATDLIVGGGTDMTVLESTQDHATITHDISPMLPAGAGEGGGWIPMVAREEPVYSLDEKMGNTYCHEEQANTLANRDYKQPQPVAGSGYTVRRLTELECTRLQGYPDNWIRIGELVDGERYWTDTKGKKHKLAASHMYKALGNSIAIPYWAVLARRICARYDRKVTVGSLFDGIGGFPLAFSMAGAKPIWASEIEEFPIAVTKERFPEHYE